MNVTEHNTASHNDRELEALRRELEEVKGELRTANAQLNEFRISTDATRRHLQNAIRITEGYAGSKLVKLSVFLRTLRYMGMSKDPALRKRFWKTLGRGEDTYSPPAQALRAMRECPTDLPEGVLTDTAHTPKGDYTAFDVIVFGIIDYNSLYQRPQQFADRFAAEGHRVFFINSTFHRGSDYLIHEKKPNLFLVDLPCETDDTIYSIAPKGNDNVTAAALERLLHNRCISDALMIADYPNWVHLAAKLKRERGFALMTDYMDDFGGFDNAEQNIIVSACNQLLECSDHIAASSLYLLEQAKQHSEQVSLIRNGTEFDHFHQAFGQKEEHPRKIIGYYGAVSHWFDFDMIEYLSTRFPQHDIVLIGAVVAGEERLKRLPNVRLTGVKPYTELPEFLRSFDVCLIPFDASINLIKATNPVKFYEYLSAGKKIVATEIPELEPFRNRYVYLANDPQLFGDYVAQCLNGSETLATAEECMAFARENDWDNRFHMFADVAKSCFPSVNILLTEDNQEQILKIRSMTAYPNYKIILPGQTQPESDYTLILQKDEAITRGWLSEKMAHTKSADRSTL